MPPSIHSRSSSASSRHKCSGVRDSGISNADNRGINAIMASPSAGVAALIRHEHRDLLVGAILLFLTPENDMRDFSIGVFKPQNSQLVAKEIVVGVALTIV